MNTCYDLTVNVGVLMNGSKIGNPENLRRYLQSSRDLMKKMKKEKRFILSVDNQNIIIKQYWKKLRGTYGELWLREMAGKKKIKSIDWIYINRGKKVALREARFPINSEDFNYVRTAASTICKFLVSHDPHYSNQVCRVLRRRLEIRVKAACQCHEL